MLEVGRKIHEELTNLLAIFFRIEEPATLGPLEGGGLELTALDHGARGIRVECGHGPEHMFDDRMIAVLGGYRDLVRGVAPAVLPEAGIRCGAGDAVTPPVLRLHAPVTAVNAAAKEPLE